MKTCEQIQEDKTRGHRFRRSKESEEQKYSARYVRGSRPRGRRYRRRILRSETRAYFEVRSFFKALASDDWDGAAEKVWFFDDAENIGNGTELSEEDAEKVWKKRVEEQKNGEYANYLVDFSELKVYKKDGELYADVRLHLRERGVATYRKTTVRLNDGGIYTVADYPPEQLNSLESALSGYVGDR